MAVDNMIMPKQKTSQGGRSEFAFAIIVSLLVGFVVGFYVNQSRVANLEREVSAQRERDQMISQAEKDVQKSLEASTVSEKQIKQAELDVLESLKSSTNR